VLIKKVRPKVQLAEVPKSYDSFRVGLCGWLRARVAYRDEDLVFSLADDAPIKPWNFGASFPGLVKRAGVTKVRLHDLRDTHASLMAMAGQPLDVISKRLGHSNIAITMDRYMTVYTSRDEAASEAFAALLR
jgi:integrase